MKDAGFFVPQEKRSRFATNYKSDDQEHIVPIASKDAPGDDYSLQPAVTSGGGGLVSTAEDYYRFAQMLGNSVPTGLQLGSIKGRISGDRGELRSDRYGPRETCTICSRCLATFPTGAEKRAGKRLRWGFSDQARFGHDGVNVFLGKGKIVRFSIPGPLRAPRPLA